MIIQSNDTPHHIALGIGLGLFAGVAIPLGQFILALILAFIFKANKIFAVAATFITNPYTTPILYPGLCYLGSKITGINITIEEINQFVHEMLYSFTWDRLFDMGTDLIISYLVGGCILGLVLGGAGYIISFKIAIINRKRKEVKQENPR